MSDSGVADVLHVRVELLNDKGDRRFEVAEGQTVDRAVSIAEYAAWRETGDESWTMNEWAPA